MHSYKFLMNSVTIINILIKNLNIYQTHSSVTFNHVIFSYFFKIINLHLILIWIRISVQFLIETNGKKRKCKISLLKNKTKIIKELWLRTRKYSIVKVRKKKKRIKRRQRYGQRLKNASRWIAEYRRSSW